MKQTAKLIRMHVEESNLDAMHFNGARKEVKGSSSYRFQKSLTASPGTKNEVRINCT